MFDAQLEHQPKIILEKIVVPALLHLIDAGILTVLSRDDRVAVLDAGAENEPLPHLARPLLEDLGHSMIVKFNFGGRKHRL
jgi:hypothetical protein